MPLWTRSVRASRILARLQDERGIALIMALGILFVLTISLGTVIFMTSASARHAEHSNAGQKSYALAEAGLNNALAVLNANYPGTVAFPGDSGLLPPRQTTYDGGSCTAPVNNCATWSGTLAGPLVGSPWKWEWRITSTGTVRNPTGPSAAPVMRTAKAVVPVVIPTTSPASAAGPLNFLYSGKDMWFQNSVHVKAPVYVTGDLHLESTAVIDGASIDLSTSPPTPKPNKAAIGHDLYLKNPQNQIGLTGGGDPRISEIHVVNKCSSKKDPALHACGPATADWDFDAIFATVHDNVIPPGFISFTPQLTCCAPAGGTILPSGSGSQQHGILVPERRSRAPGALHDGLAADLGLPERIRQSRAGASRQLDQLERDADHGDQPDSSRHVLHVQVDGGIDDPW